MDPTVKMSPVVKIRPMTKANPVAKTVQLAKLGLTVKTDPMVKANPTAKTTPMAKVDLTVKTEPMMKADPVVKADPMAKMDPICLHLRSSRHLPRSLLIAKSIPRTHPRNLLLDDQSWRQKETQSPTKGIPYLLDRLPLVLSSTAARMPSLIHSLLNCCPLPYQYLLSTINPSQQTVHPNI